MGHRCFMLVATVALVGAHGCEEAADADGFIDEIAEREYDEVEPVEPECDLRPEGFGGWVIDDSDDFSIEFEDVTDPAAPDYCDEAEVEITVTSDDGAALVGSSYFVHLGTQTLPITAGVWRYRFRIARTPTWALNLRLFQSTAASVRTVAARFFAMARRPVAPNPYSYKGPGDVVPAWATPYYPGRNRPSWQVPMGAGYQQVCRGGVCVWGIMWNDVAQRARNEGFCKVAKDEQNKMVSFAMRNYGTNSYPLAACGPMTGGTSSMWGTHWATCSSPPANLQCTALPWWVTLGSTNLPDLMTDTISTAMLVKGCADAVQANKESC